MISLNPFIGNTLNLNFNSLEKGIAHVKVFSTPRGKIIDLKENKGANNTIIIHANNVLISGFYIVQAQLNETAYSTNIIVEKPL